MKNRVQKEKKSGKSERKVRVIVINSIRALLILAFLSAFFGERKLILFMSAFGFFLTFLPAILEKTLKVKIPASFEVILILFIYGLLLLGKVRGYYAGLHLLAILLNFTSAIVLGLVGLTVLYSLHKEDKINASPLVIAIFSFCFAVAVGVLWEMFEFGLDKFFGFSLQQESLTSSMGEMAANVAGAIIVSFAGYFYIKNGKITLISRLISSIVEKNPSIFKSEKEIENTPRKILNLIKEGESKNVEFKSTLRTNLHTKQIDKKIEHAVLKTLVAYLNTDGGTLLVGVSDKGEILGVEEDNFSGKDKLNLHFTNLIKQHIGPEYLPFIKFDLIPVNEKSVMKIDCKKSHRHVFLKTDEGEEFYVRNGPSTASLTGSSLVEYINNNFRNS